MSDSNELKPNTPAGTPVPDLIEQYRVRRDAWIAQADELARLRDEVRGSAEREAMEIVTAARRDVRQIVMEARRELLVLSAQVQAALGEASTRPDSTGLLGRAGDTDGGLEKPDFADAIFSHQDAVKGMLDEARADMDALDEDARTVPFQALAEPPKLPPPPELPSVFSEDTLVVEPNTLVAPNTITAVPPHGPASSLTPADLARLCVVDVVDIAILTLDVVDIAITSTRDVVAHRHYIHPRCRRPHRERCCPRHFPATPCRCPHHDVHGCLSGCLVWPVLRSS
jgi:hypothetical protein